MVGQMLIHAVAKLVITGLADVGESDTAPKRVGENVLDREWTIRLQAEDAAHVPLWTDEASGH
jgi:hypothetical protein